MMRQGWPVPIALLVCLIVSGCGDSVEMVEPEIDIAVSDVFPGQRSEFPSSNPDATEADEAKRRSEGELRFSLKTGGQFPLQKHVQQTLVQDLPGGQVTSRSDLKLMFAITVDAEDNGRRRLGVRYQRVQYAYDFSGEKGEFDSLRPPEYVPDSLQMYNGLANNGFDFWIGADNRIVEVIGFQDFLRRCVRFAPPTSQNELLKKIQVTSEDEGFANFVDDSIGLLPYNPDAIGRETMVRVDDSWHRNRDIREPLPMRIRTTYTLTDLTEHQAHVVVLGTIEPITATQLGSVQHATLGERLTLEGGQVRGTIVIDVTTGLPLNSHIERRMKMNVYVPGEEPFQQFKTIITNVESFPTQGQSETGQPAAGPIELNRRPERRAPEEQPARPLPYPM